MDDTAIANQDVINAASAMLATGKLLSDDLITVDRTRFLELDDAVRRRLKHVPDET